MTEKRKPTYDLNSIKAAFATPADLQVTGTAVRTAAALGFDRLGMIDVIQGIERRHFVKSITSHADHQVWQDVYDVPSPVGDLYVKFTAGTVTEFLLLSFKEKGDG